MQLINLFLDFKTGPKKVDLILSDGNACFRRVSDIYHFKAILDTWIALNSKLPEIYYNEQLQRMLPGFGELDLTRDTTPLTGPKPKRKVSKQSSKSLVRPNARSIERELNTINSTYYSHAKNPNSYTPIQLNNPKNYATADTRLSPSLSEARLPNRYTSHQFRPQNPRIDTFYDGNGAMHYSGEVSKGQANGDGTLFYPTGAMEYEGQFANNLLQGYGNLYNENGSLVYRGYFHEGVKSGTGVEYYHTGSKLYEGQFGNDKWNGYGKW
jgi:antitoxin component YwqK of YwqJK toxin-antitoxin module